MRAPVTQLVLSKGKGCDACSHQTGGSGGQVCPNSIRLGASRSHGFCS
jgi:hypothetical protein